MPTPGTPCWMHITFVLCRRRRPGSDPQTECCWACPENNLQLTRFASDPPRSAKMGIKQRTCLKTGTTQTQKHPARKGRSCHQHVIFSFLKFVKVIWKETFFFNGKPDCDHEENPLQLHKYLLRVYWFRSLADAKK